MPQSEPLLSRIGHIKRNRILNDPSTRGRQAAWAEFNAKKDVRRHSKVNACSLDMARTIFVVIGVFYRHLQP